MKHKRTSVGFTLIELLVVVAMVAIVFGIAGTSCDSPGINISHGTGTKIGQIVKLSKQGWSRKTWEGQLIRGGMSDGSGSFGTTPFDFTVENEEMSKVVDKYMRDQVEVVIK